MHATRRFTGLVASGLLAVVGFAPSGTIADTPPLPGGSGGGSTDPLALPSGDPATDKASGKARRGPRDESAGAPTVDLRPRWRAGERLRYLLDLDSRTFTREPDAPASDDNPAEPLTRMDQRMKLLISPRTVGDTESTVDLTIEAVSVKFSGDAGEGAFDSDQSAGTAPLKSPGSSAGEPRFDEQLRAAFGPMAGKTMTLTIDRSGAITKVTGGNIVDLGGLASLLGPSAPAGGGVPGVGGGGLGGGGGGEWLISGPPAPSGGTPGLARVGQSWTDRDSLGGTPAGGMSLITTHTLRSSSGGIASIAFSGSIEPSSQSPETSPADKLNPLMGLLQGVAHRGSYRFDTERGRLIELDSTMTIETASMAEGVLPALRTETKMTVRLQR